MNPLDLAVSELSTAWGIMKYLEKSFTLPASGPKVTDEEWAAIWAPTKAVLAERDKALFCPNCHCAFESYRHIETCVTPGESD